MSVWRMEYYRLKSFIISSLTNALNKLKCLFYFTRRTVSLNDHVANILYCPESVLLILHDNQIMIC